MFPRQRQRRQRFPSDHPNDAGQAFDFTINLFDIVLFVRGYIELP